MNPPAGLGTAADALPAVSGEETAPRVDTVRSSPRDPPSVPHALGVIDDGEVGDLVLQEAVEGFERVSSGATSTTLGVATGNTGSAPADRGDSRSRRVMMAMQRPWLSTMGQPSCSSCPSSSQAWSMVVASGRLITSRVMTSATSLPLSTPAS